MEEEEEEEEEEISRARKREGGDGGMDESKSGWMDGWETFYIAWHSTQILGNGNWESYGSTVFGPLFAA
jgi:hypothetical protein